MTEAHTPGPWDYVPANEHHGPYVTTDYGTTVADLYVLSEPVVWSSETRKPIPFMGEMAEANARLIAAAPTMFDYIAARAADGDPEATQIMKSLKATTPNAGERG